MATGTSSAALLPWPTEWAPPRPRKFIWLMLYLVMVTIAMIPAGWIAYTAGETWAVFILVLGSPAFVFVLVLGYLVRLRGRERRPSSIDSRQVPDVGHQGLVVPYSLTLYVGYWLTMFHVFVGFGLLAVLFALGAGLGSFGEIYTTIGVLTLGLTSLYCLAFCAQFLVGKITRGMVALTPQGVYHQSWVFRSFAPWEGILSVRALEVDGPLIELDVAANSGYWFHRTSRLWKQEELAAVPNLAIRGRWLSVDPALLYHALRYYHQHPEARGELDGHDGVQRLREAALTAG